MPHHICQIHDCTEQATWKVATIGHPNSRDNNPVFYCQEHFFVPAWRESSKQYKIEITDPLNIAKNA